MQVAEGIDTFSYWTGRVVYWLTLLMVLIGAYNAIVRYAYPTLSSNAYIEMQWYLFSLVFLLGAAYTLRQSAHVRVDVLYGKLSPRGKAWIDLAGTVLFLIPFCVFIIWVSWSYVGNSWAITEQSPDPGGLPRYPIKTIIPLAFGLLLIQSVSIVIRQVAFLRGAIPEDERRHEGEEMDIERYKEAAMLDEGEGPTEGPGDGDEGDASTGRGGDPSSTKDPPRER